MLGFQKIFASQPEVFPQKAAANPRYTQPECIRNHPRFKSVDAVRTKCAAFHEDVVGGMDNLSFWKIERVRRAWNCEIPALHAFPPIYT